MKTRILFVFLISLMVMASMALGGLLPQPVSGEITVEGYHPEGLTLIQKNLRLGVEHEVKVDSNGFFIVDWSNYGFHDGDQVEISIKMCKDLPSCSQIITLTEGVPNHVIISSSSLEHVTEESIYYVCSDGVKVSDKDDCEILSKIVINEKETIVDSGDNTINEVIKETTTEKYVCADETLVDDPSECEVSESWLAWVIGILAGLFASIAGASGWKFYNGKFKHYHRGIVSYHDPNARHSNLKYRHITWKESVLGCLKDVGKIQKGIDLSTEE